MDLTATALEIPFSNAPGALAIAPAASLPFLAAARARSGVFPAGNAAQTDPAFPLPDANRNHARRCPLRLSLSRGKLFPVRAKLFAPPDPFASSAQRSFEIFVDLPEASRSIARGDCLDWGRVAAEASGDPADLDVLLAAARWPIQSR